MGIRQVEFGKQESGEGVKELIEQLAQQEADGLIANMVVVVLGTDRTCSSCAANFNQPILAVGALEFAKVDFMAQIAAAAEYEE